MPATLALRAEPEVTAARIRLRSEPSVLADSADPAVKGGAVAGSVTSTGA